MCLLQPSDLPPRLSPLSPGSYDFFYLPLDFRNRCNLGYAFVNFITAEVTASFFMVFQGTRWEDFNSRKVCNIAYARLQGKAALVDHFRSSRGFHAGGSEEFLPVVFDLPAGGMFAAPQPLLPPQPPPLPHGMYGGGAGVANLGAALQVQAQLLQQQILNHELQLQERALRMAAKNMQQPVWQGGAPPPGPPPPGPPPPGAARGHLSPDAPAYPPAVPVQGGAGGPQQHFAAHMPSGAAGSADSASGRSAGGKAGGQLASAQPMGGPPPGLAPAQVVGQGGGLVHGGLPVAIPLSGMLHPQFTLTPPAGQPRGSAAGGAQAPPLPPGGSFGGGADGSALPVAVPMPDPPLPPGAPPPLPPGSHSSELQQQQLHLQEQLKSLQAQQQQQLQMLQQQQHQLQQQHHQQQGHPGLLPGGGPPPLPREERPGSALTDEGYGFGGGGGGSGDEGTKRSRSRGSSVSLEEQIQQLPTNPFAGGDAAGDSSAVGGVDWSVGASDGLGGGFRSPVGGRRASPDQDSSLSGGGGGAGSGSAGGLGSFGGIMEGGLYGIGSPRGGARR